MMPPACAHAVRLVSRARVSSSAARALRRNVLFHHCFLYLFITSVFCLGLCLRQTDAAGLDVSLGGGEFFRGLGEVLSWSYTLTI